MSRLVDLYGKYHVSPQFESLGNGPVFMGARYLHVYGSGVNVGNNATFVATSDSYIRLTTWNLGEFDGKIIAERDYGSMLGSNIMPLDLSSYAKGIYVIELIINE